VARLTRATFQRSKAYPSSTFKGPRFKIRFEEGTFTFPEFRKHGSVQAGLAVPEQTG
jgi:hypothetical protein